MLLLGEADGFVLTRTVFTLEVLDNLDFLDGSVWTYGAGVRLFPGVRKNVTLEIATLGEFSITPGTRVVWLARGHHWREC